MFGRGEDWYTTTVEDAELWERRRGGGFGPRDDQPSASDLEEDAYQDRFEARKRAEREAAARARGEYVPDVPTQMGVSVVALGMIQVGVQANVRAHRDGVLWVACAGAEEAAGLLGGEGRYETKVADGGFWVRMMPIEDKWGGESIDPLPF